MGQTRQDDTRTELSRPGEPGLTTRMVEKGIQQQHGGADLAATASLNGMNFLELWLYLTPRAPRLDMKDRVYASCVRNSMTYGSETMPLLAEVGLKFERSEMPLIR